MRSALPVSSASRKTIRAPNGTLITADDLPRTVDRWTVSKKVLIMLAITEGLITIEEAAERYFLSIEELASWKKLDAEHGPSALRSTRLQEYRGNLMAG